MARTNISAFQNITNLVINSNDSIGGADLSMNGTFIDVTTGRSATWWSNVIIRYPVSPKIMYKRGQIFKIQGDWMGSSGRALPTIELVQSWESLILKL